MLKNLIRPPFYYIGAKTKLLEWIYSFFPEHTTFVDVFGGTGVVTFNKIPSKNDVYNDINSRIVNFYAVLRDEYMCAMLRDLIALTPFARTELKRSAEPTDDPVEDARRFYVQNNMSFSGNGQVDSFCLSRGSNSKKNYFIKFYKTRTWKEPGGGDTGTH